MQKEFFGSQVERLRRVYSPTSLNDERVQLLWDRFKGIDGSRFELAVNHLIGEYTTQALPSLSRFAEAAIMFQTRGVDGSRMAEALSAHFCEPCGDFGFDWAGDTIVACKRCQNGREIGPEKLAREQKNYDRGRAMLRNPGQILKAMGAPLPYNPEQRGELPAHDPIDRSGEWR